MADLDGGAGAFELNEELVRNVLHSLGYSDVSDADLAEILQQTETQLAQPAAAAAGAAESAGGGGGGESGRPRGASRSTSSRRDDGGDDDDDDDATGGGRGGSAPIDDVGSAGEYDEYADMSFDDQLRVAAKHSHHHHHHPQQPQEPEEELKGGGRLFPLHAPQPSSRRAAAAAAAHQGPPGPSYAHAHEDAHGHHHPPPPPPPPPHIYRAEREYAHQQRFRPFLAMERRARQQQQQLSQRPAAPGPEPPVPPPHAVGSDHENGARPRSRERSANASFQEAESRRLRQRLGVQHHHAPMFYSRTSSNVIYAFTDDKSYLPRRGNNAAKVQMAPPRRHVDVVARGQQMRHAWERDTFLAQKGRSEERWMVRQSMLGGGLY